MSAQLSTLRMTLVGLVSLAVAMGIGRFVFTPLLPLMRADGLVDIAEGGLLASVHFLGYLLGAMFAARAGAAPGRALRLCLVAIGACTLAMGLTENIVLWLLLRWMAGVCSALVLVLVSNFYINHLAVAGQAQAQGWVFSGVGAGVALSGLGVLAIMVAGIASAQSWQIFGATSLVAALVVSVSIGPEVDDARKGATRPGTVNSPLVWRIVIPYGAAGLGYVIPATYLPVMARAIIQDPLIFGWAWPVFGVAAFISTLLAAWAQRRFSCRQIWIASQIVMAAGLMLPALSAHITAIIAAGICVGGTVMTITMMGVKEAHRLASATGAMRQIAAMTAAFAGGQMIGPMFASTIFDLTGSFSPTLVLTSIALVATAVMLMGGESGKQAVVQGVRD